MKCEINGINNGLDDIREDYLGTILTNTNKHSGIEIMNLKTQQSINLM